MSHVKNIAIAMNMIENNSKTDVAILWFWPSMVRLQSRDQVLLLMFWILKLMWENLLSNWHHSRKNYVKSAFWRSFWLFLWGVSIPLNTFIKYVVFQLLACLRHFLPLKLERRGLEMAKIKCFDSSNLPDLYSKQLKFFFLGSHEALKHFWHEI